MEKNEGLIGGTGERQRYGRNKNTVVNQNYIASGEYRRKFDQITSDKQVNRLIYKVSKDMLQHQSGTEYEDMYWIDAETDSVIYAQKEEKRKLGIVICHDGSIYVYTAYRYISQVLWNSYINAASKDCYSEIEIQKKAIDKFMQMGDIYCREVNVNESYG